MIERSAADAHTPGRPPRTPYRAAPWRLPIAHPYREGSQAARGHSSRKILDLLDLYEYANDRKAETIEEIRDFYIQIENDANTQD